MNRWFGFILGHGVGAQLELEAAKGNQRRGRTTRGFGELKI